MKHTCIAITTCATFRFTFATSIYNTCNITLKKKHLKYTSATCVFSVTSACCLDEWRLIDAALDAAQSSKLRHGGHRCGARRRYGPRQGQKHADGARPRQEAQVQVRASERLARRGRCGRGLGPSREQSEGDVGGTAWASAGSVRTDERPIKSVSVCKLWFFKVFKI